MGNTEDYKFTATANYFLYEQMRNTNTKYTRSGCQRAADRYSFAVPAKSK
jgi:hypothetical protein